MKHLVNLFFLIISLVSCMQPQKPQSPEPLSMLSREDSIKKWIHQYIDEVWNKRDFSRADQYWGPEFVNVFNPEAGKGPVAMRNQVDYFIQAFESFRFELKDILVEGDKVAIWFEISGKHTGELFGIPATNREVRFREAAWYTIKDGKLHEVFPFVDWNQLFSQLGTYPKI